MAYNYEYPYVSSDRCNADWILSKVKEIDNIIKNPKDFLSPIMLNIISDMIEKEALSFLVEYDENTETLKISAEVNKTYADGLHIFDPNSHVVSINEEEDKKNG